MLRRPIPCRGEPPCLVLRNSRYNQHATTGSLLVEMGAAGNSLDEALLAARLFTEQMIQTIQAKEK